MRHTLNSILFIFSFLILLSSCSKKKQLNESVNPNVVNFSVSQPSTAIAQFAAKCTNYDIVLDSVIFLSPDNGVYKDFFNEKNLQKNEAFQTGHWEAVDGMWILQFKGSIQNSDSTFSVSVPYQMNIDGDGE